MRVAMVAVMVVGLTTGCARPSYTLTLEPVPDSSHLIIHTATDVGDLLLWLPEAIATERGFSSIYPRGEWRIEGQAARQDVGAADLFKPGNFQISEHSVECAGIRVPREAPVSWTARAQVQGDRVRFALIVRNEGSETLRSVGAPICLKFLRGQVWSPEQVHARAAGQVRALDQLGDVAGKVPGFEAYLLCGRTYPNRFYEEFWGFNPNCVDEPELVTDCPTAGVRVGIRARRAVFVHANRLNPCTDVMLDLGDLEPGASASAEGVVWLEPIVRSIR